MENIQMQNLLRQLHLIYEGDPWIGESFNNKLDDMSEEEAFKQPLPGIHSVAEVLSHLIEWRKELIGRFETGRPPLLKMESANNWYSNEKLREDGWGKLREEFAETQRQLNNLWEGMDDSFLSRKYQGNYNFQFLVEGIIHHDVYHLGQIGLIIKMVRNC